MSSSSEGGGVLLHNMSARPRTTIVRTVPRLRTPWTRFIWPGRPPRLSEQALDRLQNWWVRTGFTGAAIVVPTGGLDGKPSNCQNEPLTLNVLLRVRTRVLIASMDLVDDPDMLRGSGYATEDPRLVELAKERVTW